MGTLNYFKKCFSLCTDGKTGNRKTVAPKSTLFFSLFKKTLPLLLFFFYTTAFSQFLIADRYVGCVGFGGNGGSGSYPPPRGVDFTEHIENDPSMGDWIAPCLMACENMQVNYWFFEPNSIESVSWEVEGGTIIDDWSTPEHKVLIQWGATGQGFLTVELTLTDNSVIERVICIDIIQGPTAKFDIGTLKEEEGNVSCTNASVGFDNLSVGGLHYLWDFGDYDYPDTNYSSQFEPEHIYKKPGTYTVTLTVVNSCNCEDVYRMEIVIEDAPPLLISCPGIVCELDRVTYTVNDSCGGEWKIEGGTVTDGGDGYDFAEVVWDSIDLELGFGYIHYRSGCGCPFWTTEKIPVVTQNSVIQGDDVICMGEQSRYTLPQWATTEYHWKLITDTNPTQVVWLDQRNEIIIEGLEPGDYILQCEYKNTLLGCEGLTEKGIKIIPKIEITGEHIFCSSTYEQRVFTTVLGGNADWTLTDVNGYLPPVVLLNEDEFGYIFPFPGLYMLTASSGTGCTSDPFIIQILESSTDPFDGITGALEVCVGQTYTYSCPFDAPGTVLVWSVSGSAVIQGANTGNSVNIKFTGPGPYTITVERTATAGGIVCYYWSESFLSVDNADFDLEITHGYTAPLKFCPSTTSTFTADFDGGVPEHISWEIVPAGFGNIVSGGNDFTVVVSWNEVSGTTTTGTLKVTATVCGVPYTDTIAVTVFKTPTISITNTIPALCPEKATIDVTVNVSGINSGQLKFDFGNGTLPQYKTFGSSGNTTHTINNMFTNTSPTGISQTLTVTLVEPNGCPFSPSATQNITVYPQTEIIIYPQYNVTFCSSAPFTHTLTSNLSTGITGSEEFQWYRNGVLIQNAISNTYTVTHPPVFPMPPAAGVYTLEVKDKNSCLVLSQGIVVSEDCNPVVPCTVSPNR